MKNKEIRLRPSIDNILERLILYCNEKKYSDSIDVVSSLKRKETFVQTPYNDDLFMKIKIYKPEEEISLVAKPKIVIGEKALVGDFYCMYVDGEKGRFDIENKCYFNNDMRYPLNSFDYPYFIQENTYVYLADIKTEKLIKYK